MEIIYYCVMIGGGKSGRQTMTIVSYDDDGRCYVEEEKTESHDGPVITKRYFADGLLEQFSKECEKYNVRSWTDLPDNEAPKLDWLPCSKYRFTFEDCLSIDAGSSKQYPEKWREFTDVLVELIKKAEEKASDITVTEE